MFCLLVCRRGSPRNKAGRANEKSTEKKKKGAIEKIKRAFTPAATTVKLKGKTENGPFFFTLMK